MFDTSNVIEEINIARNNCVNVVNERANMLIEYSSIDSDIASFIHYVLGKFENNSIYDYKQSSARYIMYKLGYNLENNSFHSTDTTYILTQFIGNYFLDDSSAVVYFDDENKIIVVKDDSINGHQNVKKYLETIDKSAQYMMEINKLMHSRDFKNPLLKQYFQNHR